MGVKRRLGELSCLYSVLSPPFGNRVQLSQQHNGARANSLPFERSRKGFCVLPRAEFVGELSDALGAVLRDEDRDLAQLLR
jgi:hypothetical protein